MNLLLWNPLSTLMPLMAQAASPAPLQTAAPAPTSAEIELLKSQIEFLKTANASLAESFNRYVGTLNQTLTIVGLVLTVLTLIGGVLFGKSLADYYGTLRTINKEVDRIVRRQVEQEVGVVIRNRVDRLEGVLAREAILGRVTVDYMIPTDQISTMPNELTFLQRRGFQTTAKFISPAQFHTVQLPADVVVLDLYNAKIPPDQADGVIDAFVNQVDRVRNQRTVLVIYIVGYQSSAVNRVIAEGIYCVPAQSPLSLVGRVVDAAYVADALRN